LLIAGGIQRQKIIRKISAFSSTSLYFLYIAFDQPACAAKRFSAFNAIVCRFNFGL